MYDTRRPQVRQVVQQQQRATHAGHPATALAALPFQGIFDDIERLNPLMATAWNQCHLISPTAVCSAIADGYSVIVTPVYINPYASGMVFKLRGEGANARYMLAKPALFQIGRAAGVSWDPRESRRVDSEQIQHVWRYKAVGSCRDFSGQRLGISGEREIDAREGSPQLDVILRRAEAKKKEDSSARVNPHAEIRELRLHGYSHAETKAHLRALRTLGIATSYTLEELKKPFVAVNTAFTGRSSDPERERVFAMMIAQHALGSTVGLYGPEPAREDSLHSRSAPVDAAPSVAPGRTETPAVAKATPPREVVPPLPAKLSGYKVRRGVLAGEPIEKLPTRELVRHCEDLRDDIEEGQTYNAVADTERLDAVYAEIQRREVL